MNLCTCTKCGNIHYDINVHPGTVDYGDVLNFQKLIVLKKKKEISLICSFCKTDEFLTDTLDAAKYSPNREVIVEAIVELSKDGINTNLIKELKDLILNKDITQKYPIITQLLNWEKVPVPTGRMLSSTERDKINSYFGEDFSFTRYLSRDGKLYFGPLDEEYEKNPVTIDTWGYITEEQLQKQILSKKKDKEQVKKNPVSSLGWYDKLMKKIK